MGSPNDAFAAFAPLPANVRLGALDSKVAGSTQDVETKELENEFLCLSMADKCSFILRSLDLPRRKRSIATETVTSWNFSGLVNCRHRPYSYSASGHWIAERLEDSLENGRTNPTTTNSYALERRV